MLTVETHVETSAIDTATKMTLPIIWLSDFSMMICLVAVQLKNGC